MNYAPCVVEVLSHLHFLDGHDLGDLALEKNAYSNSPLRASRRRHFAHFNEENQRHRIPKHCPRNDREDELVVRLRRALRHQRRNTIATSAPLFAPRRSDQSSSLNLSSRTATEAIESTELSMLKVL